ncbi:uracil-DNA glycosylase [Paenibacillus sp. OV219]|uniref:uracil-DNA glycosylase n=1 Tax=Paenibacillus sp. OV219 TaxID=1884377 RepID=UPI0008B2D6A5|nr:uracil-DNA glycosylase [Paenibacillus sp. OV219]SEM63641.1 hypothetical protein SAMN05518847_101374 [Paenibacillus sp. OV219]
MTTEQTRIDCMKCRHFYITWDKNYPRGCKAFKFKGSAMPSAAVLSSSGKPCMNFEPKSMTKPPQSSAKK